MPFTREDSRRWVKENIARICAEQGITVEIKDPVLLAKSASILRVGKERLDAARIERLTSPRSGRDRNLSQVSS